MSEYLNLLPEKLRKVITRVKEVNKDFKTLYSYNSGSPLTAGVARDLVSDLRKELGFIFPLASAILYHKPKLKK